MVESDVSTEQKNLHAVPALSTTLIAYLPALANSPAPILSAYMPSPISFQSAVAGEYAVRPVADAYA